MANILLIKSLKTFDWVNNTTRQLFSTFTFDNFDNTEHFVDNPRDFYALGADAF